MNAVQSSWRMNLVVVATHEFCSTELVDESISDVVALKLLNVFLARTVSSVQYRAQWLLGQNEMAQRKAVACLILSSCELEGCKDSL